MEVIELEDGVIKVEHGINLRNNDWGASFGAIQKLLQPNGKPKSYIFDFTKINWIDPLPILSYLVELYELKKLGIQSKVILPSINSPNNEQKKVLAYLYNEGFLFHLIHCSKVTDSDGYNISQNYESEDFKKTISNFATNLYYTNSTLLEATIIDSTSLTDDPHYKIDAIVNSYIKDISTRLSYLTDINILDNLLHKLVITLSELIQNIVLHAYTENPKSHFGLYIRLRNGLENKTLSTNERKRLNQAIKLESQSCPRLIREFLDVNIGCVELFITDSGQGFSNSLKENLGKNYKYPFRQAFDYVFKKGLRRIYKGSPDKTELGGLYLIGEMLKSGQDYLCGRDENEWVGGTLPIESSSYELCSPKGSSHPKGLSWIIRFSWKNRFTRLTDEHWSNWIDKPSLNPLYKIYEKTATEIKLKNLCIVDLRWERQNLSLKNPSSSSLIIFTKPYQTKIGIWKMIGEASSSISLDKKKELFICDIPNNEKHIYLYALKKVKIYSNLNDWSKRFDKIHLITQGLSHLKLEYKNSTFILSDNESLSDSLKTSCKDIDNLLEVIKSYESTLLWTYLVENNKLSNFFINGSITWNNEIDTIDGYLDFAQLTTDTFCLQLLHQNLKRISGFIGKKSIVNRSFTEFKNIDILTKKLTDKLNTELKYTDEVRNEGLPVYIGSVFVSGLSKEEALFYLSKEGKEEYLHFLFFNHSSSISHVPHLFYWPDKEWLNLRIPENTKKYERIGRTYVIAEHGYKSFTMPRYFGSNLESAYFRTPPQTYQDWQNEKDQIMTFGHFHYGNKHDLFRLNIFKLIDQSFLYKHQLPIFLIGEILITLGGTIKNDLTSKADSFKKGIDQYIENYSQEINVCSYLVYPNNSFTSYIIDKIKPYLSSSIRNKFISFMPVNKNIDGSSLLISPLILDNIKKLIAKESNKNIVLFDSAVISGRTRKEIKHLLFSNGASEVYTLSITDRFRLPYKVPENHKHKSYWRFDIPRLGSKDQCHVCKGLNRLRQFKSQLASKYAIERISEIHNSWSSISYFDSHLGHGIKSTPIKSITKKFGIEFNSETNEFVQIQSQRSIDSLESNLIEIKNSLGLAIYVSELHTMTSRDDLTLKIIKTNPNLTNSAKIELICSQLLLYPNEYSTFLQFEMIKELFECTNQINREDNWTSLSALTLLSLETEQLVKLLEFIKAKGKKNLELSNLDLDLVFSYIIKEVLKTNTHQSFIKHFRLLKLNSEVTLDKIYSTIHYEIYNENGQIHSAPLKSFYSKHERDEFHRTQEALHSISKIESTLDQLGVWNYRTSSDLTTFNEQILRTVIVDLNKHQNLLKNLLNRTKLIEDKIDFEKLAIAQNSIKSSLLPKLKDLHRFLMVPYVKDEDNLCLKDEVQNILMSINEFDWKKEASLKNEEFINSPPIVKISKSVHFIDNQILYNRKNFWVSFDKSVQKQLTYSILNAIHCESTMEDVFSISPSEVRAHMWISIDYKFDYATIRLASTINETAVEIEKIILNKKKSEIDFIKHQLNGDFKIGNFNNGKGILEVRIILPTK